MQNTTRERQPRRGHVSGAHRGRSTPPLPVSLYPPLPSMSLDVCTSDLDKEAVNPRPADITGGTARGYIFFTNTNSMAHNHRDSLLVPGDGENVQGRATGEHSGETN